MFLYAQEEKEESNSSNCRPIIETKNACTQTDPLPLPSPQKIPQTCDFNVQTIIKPITVSRMIQVSPPPNKTVCSIAKHKET